MFDIATNGAKTFATALSSNGGTLTKSGTGTLTLSSSATYTGLTTISGGSLTFTGLETAAPLVGNVSLTGASARLAFNRNSDVSYGGKISGSGGLTFNGPGAVTLSGDNSGFNGAVRVFGGTVLLNSANALGNPSDILFASGGSGVLKFSAANTTDYSGQFNRQGAAQSFAFDTNGQQVTFASAFNSPVGTLQKYGAGTLNLDSTVTINGATTVSGGTLAVNGLLSASPVTVQSGATLGGSGRVDSIDLSGWLSPGRSPGTLAAADTTFQAGSGYVWEINDAASTAGSAWDLLAITGMLTLAATSSNPFLLQLHSLDLANAAGLAASFDSHSNHSFTLVSTTGGITGFDAAAFSIDASAFANPTDGGSWAVVQNGNNLDLVFTAAAAVPEPGSWALMLAGAGALLGLGQARARRRPATAN